MNHDVGVSKFKVLLNMSSIIFLMVSPLLPDVLGDKGWSAIGILLVGITLWLTKSIPPAVTSMVVVVLTSLFGILTFEEAASGLGNDVIWLVIAMLMMGVALEETSLDKRLAYNLLQMAKGNVKFTILILIALAFFMTFFIPNAIGRVTVLLPIGIGLINSVKEDEDINLNKLIIFSITFVPYVSTLALLTGASGSIYSAGLFNSMLGYSWSYLNWMIIMMPVTIIVLLLFWLILLKIFPAKLSTLRGGKDYFRIEKAKLGSMSRQEVKLMFLYAVLILLWITKDLHGMSIAMSAVLMVSLLFVPGINLLNWKVTMKKINWGIPFLYSAGFALAASFQKSGVVDWVTRVATKYLDNYSPLLLAFIMMLVFVVIRIGFTNYTAMAAALMPVVITFAMGTPYNPVWLGMVCVVASTTGYFFPTQSAGSMTTFSLGYYSVEDHFLVGSLLTLAMIAVTLILALFYWPMLGLGIYK